MFAVVLPALLSLLADAAPSPTVPEPKAAADAPAPVAFTKTVFATAAQIPFPVSFSIDEKGAVFTSNSFRYDGHGLFDVRSFPIVDDDAKCTSLEERRRLTERWVREGRLDTKERKVTLEWLAGFSEQVRRIQDTDGDGRADRVDVIADGMNDLLQGAAAGVLAWDGHVYATVIPDLWRLDDPGAPGPWPRRSLQTGFGIHMGQAGHDMHGLVMGNDGRVYWSIADRGFDLTTREGRKLQGHTGAVFRCWPDGSDLELFARGLRNPQELAFNDEGDLFTGDNNADVGDRSRLLYLPQGSDAGWTLHMQYARGCGAWTREHLWEMRWPGADPGQPAWVNLPVGHVAACPAGLAAYPGSGLPARFDGTFWLADYLGGVQSFRALPHGAGFVMADWQWAYRDSWGMCDVDFGVDGRPWVLYWGESPHGDKARLVRLTPPAAGVDTARASEVRERLATGFGGLDDGRLQALLDHADRRVRMRASFELARRGAIAPLAAVLAGSNGRRARLHAAWALGIVGHARGAAAVATPLRAALGDADADVRRVAAIVLGELGDAGATRALLARLRDPSARVQFAAAQALGQLGAREAAAPLIDVLAANADSDAVLRQACARALARTADAAWLGAKRTDASRAVRLGSVLALREAASEEVATFLGDPDPQVATEAARSAYDLELPGARAALAATLPGLRADLRIDPYLRRALYAALLTGGAAQASEVAAFAADPAADPYWRDEALRVLAQWDEPDAIDPVMARWRPQPARTPGLAHEALAARLPAILELAQGSDLGDAVELARREKLVVPGATLLAWVKDGTRDEHARLYALQWLAARRAPETGEAVDAALRSRSDSLFATGLALLASRDPARAAAAATRAAQDPAAPRRVRQAAIRALGASPAASAATFLAARLEERRRGALDPALELDVLQAVRASGAPELAAERRALAAPARAGAAATPTGAAAATPTGAVAAPMLAGGDAARGRTIFFDHPAAQCVRCHTIDGRGGTTGPDLSMAGAHEPAYLLRSLLEPSAALAPGYATTTLTLVNGRTVTGQVRSEDARAIVLATDDSTRTIPRARIRSRTRPTSAMPPMGDVLKPEELRDVVAFLASRREYVADDPLESSAPLAVSGSAPRRPGTTGWSVAGLKAMHGVAADAPSRLIYAVPAGSRAFVARVGLDDAIPGGAVGFEVRVDGRTEWTSDVLGSGRAARVAIELPPGAERIELIVNDGGNGSANDHAVWGDAGFTRRP
jgi:putative heme-binding domain-containing protein